MKKVVRATFRKLERINSDSRELYCLYRGSKITVMHKQVFHQVDLRGFVKGDAEEANLVHINIARLAAHVLPHNIPDDLRTVSAARKEAGAYMEASAKLTDPNEHVRAHAASIIQKFGDLALEHVSRLKAELSHPNITARTAAATALLDIVPEPVQFFLGVIENGEPLSMTAAMVALAMNRQRNNEIEEALLLAMEHPEEYVRDCAAKALRELFFHPAKVISVLQRAMRSDSSSYVQDSSLQSLRIIGNITGLPVFP